MALIFGFTRLICSRCATMTSRAEIFRVWISSASWRADMKHRSLAMPVRRSDCIKCLSTRSNGAGHLGPTNEDYECRDNCLNITQLVNYRASRETLYAV